MEIVTMVLLNNYSWGHELLDLHQVKEKNHSSSCIFA